jgi:DNA mismatch endonuclease (patch repair protein)
MLMAKIKGKNTKPEMIVRSICHRLGFRFRLHRADLPGKPDLVFPKHRLCILVHGCFWHQHPGCRYASLPKSRREFWGPKLCKNVLRDEKNTAELKALGWRVGVIWECETSPLDTAQKKLESILNISNL